MWKILFVVAIGSSHYSLYSNLTYKRLEKFDGATCLIEGRVADIEQKKFNRENVKVKIEKIKNEKFILPIYVNIETEKNNEICYGDSIKALVNLEKNESTLNEFKNNFFNSNFANRVFLNGTFESDVDLEEKFSLMAIFLKLRDLIKEKIDAHVKKPYCHVVNGILIGQGKEIDNRLKQSARRCGILHIFAISGLHVSILILIILKLLNFLKISNKLKLLFISLSLFCYMAIVGFAASIVRASIMAIASDLCYLMHVRIKQKNSLFIAAALILFFAPTSILGLSLILSFTSCLGIILFSKKISSKIKNMLRAESNCLIAIIESFSVSCSAIALSSPILIIAFGFISMISPIVNLFIVPVVHAIFILGILIVVLEFCIPSAASFIGIICFNVCLINFKFVEIISNFKYCIMPIEIDQIELSIIGILIFTSASYVLYRKIYVKGVTAFASLALILVPKLNQNILTEDCSKLIFVGKGKQKSVVLMNRHETIAIVLNKQKESIWSIFKLLERRGVRKIDRLILPLQDERFFHELVYFVKYVDVESIVVFNETLNKHLNFNLSDKIGEIIYKSDVFLKNRISKTAIFDEDGKFCCYVNFNNVKFAIASDVEHAEIVLADDLVDVLIVNEFLEPKDVYGLNCGAVFSIVKNGRKKINNFKNKQKQGRKTTEFLINGKFLKKKGN